MNLTNTIQYSYDSEQSLIGGLLLDNNAIDRIADIIRPEMFYFQQMAEIYRCIADMIRNNQKADVVTISNAIPEVTDLSFLTTIAQNTPSAANIRSYAEIVRDRWRTRQALFTTGSFHDALETREKDSHTLILDTIGDLEKLVEENGEVKNVQLS